MPTARELLEQADALMRRNRGGDGNIPVLTEPASEGLGEGLRGPATREPAGSELSARAERDAANAECEDLTLALDRSLQDDVEPPVLTDVVEEVAVDLLPVPGGKSDEDWLGPDTVDPELHSITGASPDTFAAEPPRALRPAAVSFYDVPVEEAPPAMPEDAVPADAMATDATAADAAPADATPLEAAPGQSESVAVPDDERWRALAEQISMQVLQRLDLFVDAGLKAKLASHLQPIVERAGNELIQTIDDHVGQLVRSYVAEAIEREITQWRQGQR